MSCRLRLYDKKLADSQYKSIYIRPVVTKVEFTKEDQEYSSFRSIPPFLDNSFTSALISRFNTDGNLKVAKQEGSDLVLECTITDFVRDTLRYDDQDRVEEYRLKIFFNYKLYDIKSQVIRKNNIVADSEYALMGTAARSESEALSELLDDASRRIVEDIVEMW